MKWLPLFLLLASPLAAQTNVGGFLAPVPWPNVPMSGNDVLNGNTATCALGPCSSPGNLSLADWATSHCTIIADNTHTSGSLWSMETSGCGSSSNNGIVSQPFTYQGLGTNIQTCWQDYTGATYTGTMDNPFKYTASAIDLSNVAGRSNTLGVNGLPSAIPQNSGGWFYVCRENLINRFSYVGVGITSQLRFPIPGEVGNSWLTNISVTEMDYPGRLFITSPVDGSKGYLWVDKVSPNGCTSPATFTLCGNVEVRIPNGASGVTVNLKAGTNSTCSTGTVQIINGTSYSSPTVVPWQISLSSLGITVAQTTPTTAFYVCLSTTNNTTSQVYPYPAYSFYPLGSVFRGTLNCYLDSDSVLVCGGKRLLAWAAYDSCTATNCDGDTSALYNITNSGSAAAAEQNYFTRWQGHGFAAPQSQASATHAGAQIKQPGPQRLNDLGSQHFMWWEEIANFSAASPIAGNGDQIGPMAQDLSTIGMNFVEITNDWPGTGWDGNFAVTSSTIPPTPSAPTISSTGGNIKSSQFIGTNYIWTKLCPAYWSALGQAGDTPQPGSCSAPVVSTNAIPVSSAISISQPMENCNNFGQLGWFVGLSFTTNNVTAPSGDTFFQMADSSTLNNSGFIACSNQGGPTTQVLVGSAGDGNSLGQMNIISAASDATQPAQPSNFPAAPTIVVNGTTGSTSWTYACTAVYTTPETNIGPTTQITNGNATLAGGNFNAVTCPSVPNATSENVYRTAHGPGASPSTTGKIGSVSNGGTLNDTGLAASGSSPTANLSVEIQQVEPGAMTAPSTLLAIVSGTTLTMPGCTGTGTGYYVGEAAGTSNVNHWKYFMMQQPGSPVSCTGTFTTIALNNTNELVPMPSDFTDANRPVWAASLSDAQMITDMNNLANGSDVANYPNAGPMIVAAECGDEANPAGVNTRCFQQGHGPNGFFQGNPSFLTTEIDSSPNDYQILRDAVDITMQDPYEGGSLLLSDAYLVGDWCRNGLLYQGTNNNPPNPTLTSGCSTGGNILAPQLSDIAAYGCMFQSYGTRPCWLGVQEFQKVSLEKGMAYQEIRRACEKGIIILKSFNDNGFGCFWWSWGNGQGMDYFWYSQGNTNAYGDFTKLSAEINEPELYRTLLSPTLDGSCPTLVSGFNCPGIGQVITGITFTQTPAAACLHSGGFPSVNGYSNSTYYPYAPLAFFTAKDPNTGDVLVGLNNLCGALNNLNTGGIPTGGAPNIAVVTLNPSGIPTGAANIEWVNGDLNGNNLTMIGSNATCPSVTVAANQFCMVMNDQETDFAWIRVPRKLSKSGQVVVSGRAVQQ